MADIKLVALDLDGTLFQVDSTIADEDRRAVLAAMEKEVEVVMSTGRPKSGLPMDEIEKLGIRYAITTNGSAIYHFPGGDCIYENPVSNAEIIPVVELLQSLDVYFDIFIDGIGYGYGPKLDVVDKSAMTPALKDYIRTTRIQLDDTAEYLRQTGQDVQKITIDLYSDNEGNSVDADKILAFLADKPQFAHVSGGYGNMEITRADANKGVALLKLAGYLGLERDQTMAIGDTENDLAIIEAAGVGVAMGNSEKCLLEVCDHVTAPFWENGVARAFETYGLVKQAK